MIDTTVHRASSSNFPPSDWVETTLGEVCTKISDGTHSTVLDVQDGDCFLLSCKNIKDGNIYIGKNERRIDKDTLNFLRKRTELQKNDILLTSVGTIGEVAYIKENDPKYEFQRSVAILKPFDFKINHLFLFYNLKSRKKYLESSAEGAVQQCLFIGRIKEFLISLPPLPEQQAIASALSAFDDKIELLREQNKILEEMGQVIFGEWFGKYGVDDELPAGWRVGKLGEIDFISFGDGNYSSKYPKQEDFVENGIPFISNKDISNGVINPNDLRYISEQQHNSLTKGHLKENDILISTRANIGDIALVSKQFENANINAQLVYIRTNNPKLYTKFLYIMFSSKKFKSIFESFSSGSAQSQLPMHALRQIEIVVPNNEILESFSETVNPIFQKMSDNFSQIQSLARSRDELLPRLMSGEVRVGF